MSIQLMSHIWANGPESQSETLVLLALADYANDDGVCWPSVNGLVKKSRLSERGVQTVLKRLCENGWLEIEYGGGRQNCNVYTIKTPQHMHPARTAPPQMEAETPQQTALNPAAAAPEPSITIKEPSLNNKHARDEVIDLLSKWSSKEAAMSFEKYRRAHKAKALTLTAAKRLSGELQEIFNAGYDPSDALGLAEERGWASVKLDWYESSQNRKKAGVKNGSYDTDSDPEFLRIVTAAARGTTRPDRR